MRVKPRKIILTLKQNSLDVNKTAIDLNIHRSTVYRWIKRARTRYGSLSSHKLKRRSTKPKSIKRVLSLPQQQEIVKLRKAKGYTAEKIVVYLNLSVCSKTVHRFLIRKRLVRQYGYHRRPRFQDTLHMHVKNTKTVGFLQMDVKYVTPELSGLAWTCFEYGVMDIYSRYKEARILNHLDQDGAMSALLDILPNLPFKPRFIQTDNGLEFQGRFNKLTKELNLKHHYIHKRNPNENAVIERSFRTDEEEFFFRLKKRPKDYDELRKLFAEYLYDYNYKRPHLGINLKTPYEVVANVLSY